MLAAMRRASSRVRRCAAERRPSQCLIIVMIAEPNAATAEAAAKIVDQSMYRAFRSLAVAALVVVSRASTSIFVFSRPLKNPF